MNKKTYALKWSVLLVLVALIALGPLASSPARAAPAAIPAAAPSQLPATTCTLTAPSERTCELWARAGTLALPDATTVPIWGYADQVTGTAQLPGPALIVSQTETVIVVLHNNLTETTALVFPGQDLVPDLVGVAAGGTITYTFVAAHPGTFLYEAGLTPNGARQVAMGLYGALIVRPAGNPGWAYDDPATAFDDEALLVLSEIDPAFNNDPAGFAMYEYMPRYWLVNGQAYSSTAAIATAAGHKVLLRQLNAGVLHHSVGLLGLHQTVLATAGSPLSHSYQVVAETIAAGQSLDTLAAIPATAAAGTNYALYETSLHLYNNNQVLFPGGPLAFGGILTFLAIPPAPPGPDTLGPLASGVQATPDLTVGAFGVTLTATLSDITTGGANVVAAEYFTDTLGAPGSGVPMSVAAPSVTVPVQAYIPPATLAQLMTGEHVYYLRGQDALGNWGPVGSAVFELVTGGPLISGLELMPDPTDGMMDLHIQATGDAQPSGPVNVVAAEYFVDITGTAGMGTPMVLNRIAPVASLTATMMTADVMMLGEGSHTFYIHAQDSLGVWGNYGPIVLHLDMTGPLASNIAVAPNPNNGYQGILPSIPAVRLEARFTDPITQSVNSNIERAEGFIDTVGSDGSGFPLIAVDALFNSPDERAYAWIPLFTIRQLDPGLHTLYVHAKDSAGNWGPVNSVVLIVDKAAPDVTGLTLTPNPTNGATAVAISATATDPANPGAPPSNIVAAEWFVGIDPGPGLGTPLAAVGGFGSPVVNLSGAINVSGWAPGGYVISVRALDAAGNWGPVATATLTVTAGGGGLIFANGFETGNFAGWAQAIGPATVTNPAAMVGMFGMQVALDSAVPGFVANGTLGVQEVAGEAIYSARFYFDPNGADTAGSQHAIFASKDVSGTTIFAIEYRHVTAAPSAYEVRAWALEDAGQRFTAWYPLQDGPNVLEIGWESSPMATVSLYVNYDLKEALEGVETYHYLVDQVQLGAPEGATPGMQGTEYFDQFESARELRVPFFAFLPLIGREP